MADEGEGAGTVAEEKLTLGGVYARNPRNL